MMIFLNGRLLLQKVDYVDGQYSYDSPIMKIGLSQLDVVHNQVGDIWVPRPKYEALKNMGFLYKNTHMAAGEYELLGILPDSVPDFILIEKRDEITSEPGYILNYHERKY